MPGTRLLLIAAMLALPFHSTVGSAFAEADKNTPRGIPSSESEPDQRKVERRLSDLVDPVKIENAPAREAFKWWATTTGISLVIDWKQMEEDGLDPGKAINIDLRNVPAGKVLGLLMKQTSPDAPLLYEVTPWYIEITTKSRADKKLVTRFYDITDLVHEPMPVRKSVRMDLSSALSAGGSRGSGSSTSVLTSDGGSGATGEAGKGEAASKLIATITGSIEPEIWENQGGPGSITYIRGFLVVKAPLYVQAQIGLPTRDNEPRPVVGTAGGPDKREGESAVSSGVGGVSASKAKTGGVSAR